MSLHLATTARRRDRLTQAALRRGGRRGLTLLEIMLAIAIMMLVTAVMVPSLSAVLMLEQRGAARKVALMYEQLQNEAILRNVTYRVAFLVDSGEWRVEVGDPNALIFSSAEDREAFEERADEVLDRMSPEEKRIYAQKRMFQEVQTETLGGPFTLPEGTVFWSVYTPQYAEPVRYADKRKDRREKDGPRIVYSYIFPNGFAEYTVIQIADLEHNDDGFTITVDPLSGRVRFHSELLDQHDEWSWLPEEGPDLDL